MDGTQYECYPRVFMEAGKLDIDQFTIPAKFSLLMT
jgi:hypothetical protein